MLEGKLIESLLKNSTKVDNCIDIFVLTSVFNDR